MACISTPTPRVENSAQVLSCCLTFVLGARYLTGESLKVGWAKFSTLS
jgi:hypothetical protein